MRRNCLGARTVEGRAPGRPEWLPELESGTHNESRLAAFPLSGDGAMTPLTNQYSAEFENVQLGLRSQPRRQQLWGVNRRMRRFRRRIPGRRSQPWGLRAHSKRMSLELEKTWTDGNVLECERYAGYKRAVMPSTKMALSGS